MSKDMEDVEVVSDDEILEEENVKSKRGKRIKRNKMKRASVCVSAFAMAGMVILSGLIYSGVKAVGSYISDKKYEKRSVSDILSSDDFKLTSKSPTFTSLLLNSGFDVDDEVICEVSLNNIYYMYEYAWGKQMAGDSEDAFVYDEYIKELIPDFVSDLECLLSTRVPGDVDLICFNNIRSSKIVSDDSYTKEVSEYNIDIWDKDLLIIMDAIGNKNNGDYFTVERINKIVSAVISVSSRDYVMVYDSVSSSISDGERVDVYQGCLEQNGFYRDYYEMYESDMDIDSVDDSKKLLSAVDSIKTYLKGYYSLDTDISDLVIKSESSGWVLVDNIDNSIYSINDEVSLLCDEVNSYCEAKDALKGINEECVISNGEWNSYNGTYVLDDVIEKVRIKK